jgi:sulfite reductase beta subunit-like hemoprotein
VIFVAPCLQLPNGEVTSEQMRYAASCIKPYGEHGCADITTRANLQLRGVKLEDAGEAWASARIGTAWNSMGSQPVVAQPVLR